ncbi:hypothetical protein [Pasteurella sp. PK-2025]|uniref:hypothetical protein n=1 Tax=Pasteurella sp. PK-2025 TaxID=3413133 RepID=UPI003C734BA3
MTIMTGKEVTTFISKLQEIGNIENPSERLQSFIESWEKLPEPKFNQPEQIAELIIYCIFEELMDFAAYRKAKLWAEKGMLTGRAKSPYSSYEYFQLGRVCYELKEYDEAMKYFDIAYQRGKKRAFQGFDKKYWEFYSKNKK